MVAVVLTDLPVAPSAANGDLTLLRKGLTDYQCAVSLIRAIDLSTFTDLPTSEPTDNFFIARGSSNYKIAFNRVSFPPATKMWFYQSSAPSGWATIKGLGDSLIACAGSTSPYDGIKGGATAGTWQQTGTALTISQIPAHAHTFPMDNHTGSKPNIFSAAGESSVAFNSTSYTTGGNGSSVSASNPASPDRSLPATVAHNHGNTWRPRAQVGIICNKTG